MQTIKIKCPNCGILLGATDDPANVNKVVVCPNCKERNRFVDFKKVIPKIVEDETRIFSFSKDSLGFLIDEKTCLKYSLKEGRFLVGRMTYKNPPKADIPIHTKDMGFSRAHFYIEVIKGRDGHYHTYVSNAANSNPTYINDVKLENDDQIGLKPNDKICSSETELRFMCNEDFDETII